MVLRELHYETQKPEKQQLKEKERLANGQQ